ncbi:MULTISPECIES: RagB/SusD family nutrient uptake outer membrane protein [unclassified Carboxylicivirga]|uniref:RagB/SusD family nutrient uptake outer membrane protein n=1 Tax=Carboxylicivirga TaxID=1628153 RepID=UPI003D33D645
MNKLCKYFSSVAIIAVMTVFTSCEDFLQREPQDFLSEESYFNKPSDLELFVNKFYASFKVTDVYGQYSLYSVDNNSDNQIGGSADINLVKGYKLVPASAGKKVGDWYFNNIRECNYFIETVESRINEGVLDADHGDVQHFRGENYFFRAWFYFNKLQAFGDFPIIKTVLADDTETLSKASKRAPRNEVARFILDDLSKAIELLDDGRSKNRISKSVAYLLASRVALFEGTWLKYHKGTARVPGGEGWPGSALYPDFSFNAGSVDDEINFFLDKAMSFAKPVADNVELSSNYQEMFVSTALESVDEVLLFKTYNVGTVTGHGATHYLQRTGGGSGYTRSLVESFLMNNGLPIYANGSNYQGDVKISDAVTDRDMRFQQSVLSEGDVRKVNSNGSKEYFDYPMLLLGSGWQGVSSGYQLEKWMSTDPQQALSSTAGITDCPIFRAAEAYLNYIEAAYERNGNLNATATAYWHDIRARAQVDTDFQKTIANTDLSKERDLATHSGEAQVDATLYNIRRERRSEFIAEGMRLMDLYRWRSLDKMENYIVEGYNFWDHYYTDWDGMLEEGDNISYSPENGGSKYYQPFRRSETNIAFEGYTFPQAHYLSPIPLDQFALTNSIRDDGVLYQNPGWSKIAAAPAE